MIKFFLFTFLVATISALISQLEEIKGRVRQIEFDSYSNVYVDSYGGADDGTDRFYKLNKTHDVIFTQDFYYIRKILINSKGDVFIIGSESGDDGTEQRYGVWRLKSNSTQSELLFKFHWNSYGDYFIDSDDNTFLNTRSGVAILRSRLNYPLAVTNLNGYNYDNHVEDGWGNVYLSNSDLQTGSVALVSKNGKQQQVPEGDKYPIADTSRVTGIVYWRFIGQVIAVENPEDDLSVITRLGLAPLLSRYDVNYFIFNSERDRLFVIERDNVTAEANKLYFITTDYQVVDTRETLNPSILDNGGTYAFDKNGTAFFTYFDVYNIRNYQILRIRYDDDQIEHIVTLSKKRIVSLEVDDNDNLWILAGDVNGGDLYLLPTNSNETTQISESQLASSTESFLKLNRDTGELFIASHNGFYVYTDN